MRVFIEALIIVCVSAFIGFACGANAARNQSRLDAIKAGCGEYYIDERGEMSFRFCVKK